VLLSEEELFIIDMIILNEAIENGERPVSVSAFISDLIRQEIDKKSDLQKSWDRNRIKQLKSK